MNPHYIPKLHLYSSQRHKIYLKQTLGYSNSHMEWLNFKLRGISIGLLDSRIAVFELTLARSELIMQYRRFSFVISP